MKKKRLIRSAGTPVNTRIDHFFKFIYGVIPVCQLIQNHYTEFEVASAPETWQEARALYEESPRSTYKPDTGKVQPNEFFNIKSQRAVTVQEVNEDKNGKTGASIFYNCFEEMFQVDAFGGCTPVQDTKSGTSESFLNLRDNVFFDQPKQEKKIDRNNRKIFGIGFDVNGDIDATCTCAQIAITKVDLIDALYKQVKNMPGIDRVRQLGLEKAERILASALFVLDNNGLFVGSEFNKKFKFFLENWNNIEKTLDDIIDLLLQFGQMTGKQVNVPNSNNNSSNQNVQNNQNNSNNQNTPSNSNNSNNSGNQNNSNNSNNGGGSPQPPRKTRKKKKYLIPSIIDKNNRIAKYVYSASSLEELLQEFSDRFDQTHNNITQHTQQEVENRIKITKIDALFGQSGNDEYADKRAQLAEKMLKQLNNALAGKKFNIIKPEEIKDIATPIIQDYIREYNEQFGTVIYTKPDIINTDFLYTKIIEKPAVKLKKFYKDNCDNLIKIWDRLRQIKVLNTVTLKDVITLKHDFEPGYEKQQKIKELLDIVVKCAFDALANSSVRYDIMKHGVILEDLRSVGKKRTALYEKEFNKWFDEFVKEYCNNNPDDPVAKVVKENTLRWSQAYNNLLSLFGMTSEKISLNAYEVCTLYNDSDENLTGKIDDIVRKAQKDNPDITNEQIIDLVNKQIKGPYKIGSNTSREKPVKPVGNVTFVM